MDLGFSRKHGQTEATLDWATLIGQLAGRQSATPTAHAQAWLDMAATRRRHDAVPLVEMFAGNPQVPMYAPVTAGFALLDSSIFTARQPV
jgi:hypothetical protein